jgi:hypothetical protein
MSTEHHIQKAINRATSRDRKHKKRFRVTGAGVFTLQRLLRTKK